MIYVIGLGLEGVESLSGKALRIIKKSGLIAGGRRHLEGLADVAEVAGERFAITSDLAALEGCIRGFSLKNKRSTVTVLATGDPLLYGIGNFIIRRFGKARVRIIPGVSVIQEAFARIKESSAGLKVQSLHGRHLEYDELCRNISSNPSLALFTDSRNTPDVVAGGLLKAGLGGVKVHVCEALGYTEEKIRSGSLKSMAREKFTHPLSVMIFIREKSPAPGGEDSFPIGMDDELFTHSANMITKAEIRAVSLSKLAPLPTDVIWDIGSCTGSVAIEAARLAPSGKVYAVEKNKKRVKDITENISRFKAANVQVITGEAPACLKGLPKPDAVFIGGGGAGIVKILSNVFRRLRAEGVIVVNAVTMETAARALEFFKKKGMRPELVQLSLTRGKEIAGLSILSACNPVFIIKGIKA
ncbi:MAG: precorrin-6y C5,15-methyltransferase (decarboxylating) subunit CbiE [Thermodesulfobacteriota bacterium]